MLRGYIEYIEDGHVGGWVYSPDIKMSGRRVLAFLDGECVGAGNIELSRPDLEQVGFGSDPLGFHFPIAPITGTEARRIYVRVDDSDFVLIGSKASIAVRSDGVRLSVGEARRLAKRIEWFYREKIITVEERYILSQFVEAGIALATEETLDEIATQRQKDRGVEAIAALLTLLSPGQIVAEDFKRENLDSEEGTAKGGEAMPPFAVFGRFVEGTTVEAAIGSHLEGDNSSDTPVTFTKLAEAEGKYAVFHSGLAFRGNPLGAGLRHAMMLLELCFDGLEAT